MLELIETIKATLCFGMVLRIGLPCIVFTDMLSSLSNLDIIVLKNSSKFYGTNFTSMFIVFYFCIVKIENLRTR